MYSCGFIEEYLDMILEAGMDGLQSLEVAAGNDLARIRANLREKMCLLGGIDTTRSLQFGTLAEVEQHVKAQIRAATSLDVDCINTGNIPGGCHDLLDVSLANVKAAIHAIKKYCPCPLNLND